MTQTHDLIQTTFDYSVLPDQTAMELRMSAERVRMRLKRSAEDIIAIGQELTAAKVRLPHGQFGVWLVAEFEMTDQTARRFMQVAERFGGKSNIMLDFSPTVLYQLAAPSTPESVVQAVTSGEVAPNVADVKRAIAEAKEAKAEAEQAKSDYADVVEALTQKERQADMFARELEALQAVREEQEENAARLAYKERQIAELQEQIEALKNVPTPEPEVIEVEIERPVIPPEVQQRQQELEQQLATLQVDYKKLAKHAYELQEQAELQAQRETGGRNARQIRLKWYSTRNALRNAIHKYLADLPSLADTEQFDADDWQGLVELQVMVERVSEGLRMLRQPSVYIVEG